MWLMEREGRKGSGKRKKMVRRGREEELALRHKLLNIGVYHNIYVYDPQIVLYNPIMLIA